MQMPLFLRSIVWFLSRNIADSVVPEKLHLFELWEDLHAFTVWRGFVDATVREYVRTLKRR